MDHFNNLPDEIIATIFRSLVISDKHRLSIYNKLHLVCRRWHAVCVSWAEHLPKNMKKFDINITPSGGFPHFWAQRDWSKCTNCDGLSDGIKLKDMLRHFEKNKNIRWLRIKDGTHITDALLLQLISVRLINCQHFKIRNCNLSGVTEKVMETFLTAIAEGKCRDVGIYCDTSIENVFTDRTLAPVVVSAPIRLVIYSSYFDVLDITDATLDCLAEHLSQLWFDIRFSNKVQQISAHGVHRFIQAFCSSQCFVDNDSKLTVPERLQSELLTLRTPDEVWEHKFVYRRSPTPTPPLPKQLRVEETIPRYRPKLSVWFANEMY